MLEQKYLIALGLTTIAGLANVIGGCLTFFVKRESLRTLSVGLGFSAGVMIYVALVEILKDSHEFLHPIFAGKTQALVFLMFFVGIGITALIDYFMPDHIENDVLDTDCKEHKCNHKIKRAGILTMLAISIHHFPEGMATFLVSAENLTLGISIAIAIAIHSIPEGIAIALPIYHATGKKREAIKYSFISGLSEPLGAIIGFFLLKSFLPAYSIGLILASVAGIMIYISFDALLPLAREYGDDHLVMWGIIAGMFFIGLGLVIF